ncbi:MAG TPA: hypothetical protein DHW82_08575 [Spirochaetia bacterium]|nr:MAG: hypothetical protein A2Y41_04940 [Spirochaetes bacterium GWB1_36_13]HCL57044.1 hypothetical protein [Spirochaetia bacterium]
MNISEKGSSEKRFKEEILKIGLFIKKTGKYIGLGIGILLLYFTLKDTDFHQVISNLQTIHVQYLALSLVSMLGLFFFKGIRWREMLKPIKKIPFSHVFSSMMVGYYFHNILPFRMGEVVRIYSLNKKEHISKSSVLGSIFAEKFFDVISLILLALLVFLFNFNAQGEIFKIGIVMVGIVSFGIIFYFSYHTMPKKAVLFIKTKVLFFLKEETYRKIADTLHNFFHGFRSLNSISIIVNSILYSMVIWIFDVLSLYFLLLSFGLHFDLMLVKSIIPIIMINLGIMIPAAPGDIGTFHYFGNIGLVKILGIEQSIATPIIIILNLMTMLPGFILGGYHLLTHHEKIDLKEINLEKNEKGEKN